MPFDSLKKVSHNENGYGGLNTKAIKLEFRRWRQCAAGRFITRAYKDVQSKICTSFSV